MQRELGKLKFPSVLTITSCLIPEENFSSAWKAWGVDLGQAGLYWLKENPEEFGVKVWDWNNGLENQEVQNARLRPSCSKEVERLTRAKTGWGSKISHSFQCLRHKVPLEIWVCNECTTVLLEPHASFWTVCSGIVKHKLKTLKSRTFTTKETGSSWIPPSKA